MMNGEIHTTVGGLFVGRIRQLWPDKAPSAISKSPTTETVRLTKTGFSGDEQADLENHGGLEKAVHHYPADHYPAWKNDLGDVAADFGPGRFGENVSTQGVTEKDICIGDMLSLGSAVIQVSQGRQPCWKLSLHTRFDRMAFLVQRTGRTGWYYRVLEEGSVREGDSLRLIERPNPDWTVETVTLARFNGKLDRAISGEISEITQLSPGWRRVFRLRSEDKPVVESALRLTGRA